MKIFLDSADIDEINEALDGGLIDGVTTNPSLIKKAQQKHNVQDMKTYIKTILKKMGDLPVSVEVTETTYEGMKREALKIKSLFGGFRNLVIKIPVNPSSSYDQMDSFDGLKLIKLLSKKKIPVNTTLIFTPEQALLAAKAGAKFVSPFAGRVDDYIREGLNMKKESDFHKLDYFPADGMIDKKGNVAHDNGVVSGVDLVAQTVDIFRNFNVNCEVLAASARNARQVREFMLAGAHVATLPLNVIKELTGHYKTVEGIISFSKDTVPEYKSLLEDKKRISISMKEEK